MSERVLVTGATGFVGRGAIEPLLTSGAEVHAVSSRPVLAARAMPGVVWHELDLLDPGAAVAVQAIGAQRLLHLAWYAQPGRFWTSERNLDWLAASVALLRAFVAGGGRRAVLAGSCAEYEWEERTRCQEGLTPLRPATLYGAAKHGLHVIAEGYARQVGLSLAWGRIFFVYGPFEDPARLAGSVASALVAGRPAETSHGEQVRDFLYAPELAEAFVALLACEVTGAVNLASGEPCRVRDLVEALAIAAQRPELVRLGARPAAAEPAELTADVTRLRDEVGWSPALDLHEGARRTVAWWQERAT